MDPSAMVVVHPAALRQSQLSEGVAISVTNRHPQHTAAFRMLTSASRQMVVAPAKGLVPPGSTAAVTIRLRDQPLGDTTDSSQAFEAPRESSLERSRRTEVKIEYFLSRAAIAPEEIVGAIKNVPKGERQFHIIRVDDDLMETVASLPTAAADDQHAPSASPSIAETPPLLPVEVVKTAVTPKGPPQEPAFDQSAVKDVTLLVASIVALSMATWIYFRRRV